MSKKKKEALETTAMAPMQKPEKKKRRKRRKAPIIIAVVLILGIVAWWFLLKGDGIIAAQVATALPFRGEVEESISTSGIVSSEEQKSYFAKVNGVLGTIHVDIGDSVKKGDRLISYDMDQMERSLQEASLQLTANVSSYNSVLSDNSKSLSKLQEANVNLSVLNQQIADFESYLTDLENKLESNQRDTSRSLSEESLNLSNRSQQLQSELERLDPLAPEFSQITQQLQETSAAQARNSYLQQIAGSSDYVVNLQKEIKDVQQRIMNCKEYKAQMEGQKTTSENTILNSNQREQYAANNEIANLSYQQVEENYYIAKEGITADFDGIVLECTAMEGALATSGMPLLTLADSNHIKVSFSASQYDLAKLEIGQNAEVTILGNQYEGKISKINRMAVLNMSGTPMVDVEITLTAPDDNIILGLDARIKVHTAKAQNALLIPVEAINADREGDFLFVVENGVAVKKSIITGVTSDTYVEVLEGLTENDVVILYANMNLEEGMAVMVTSQERHGN